MGVGLYCWFSHQVCKSHFFCAALYCHLWPVRLCLISPHYLVKGTIFERTKEEVIERKTCYLIFFTTFVLYISILQRIKRDITTNEDISSREQLVIFARF